MSFHRAGFYNHPFGDAAFIEAIYAEIIVHIGRKEP